MECHLSRTADPELTSWKNEDPGFLGSFFNIKNLSANFLNISQINLEKLYIEFYDNFASIWCYWIRQKQGILRTKK